MFKPFLANPQYRLFFGKAFFNPRVAESREDLNLFGSAVPKEMSGRLFKNPRPASTTPSLPRPRMLEDPIAILAARICRALSNSDEFGLEVISSIGHNTCVAVLETIFQRTVNRIRTRKDGSGSLVLESVTQELQSLTVLRHRANYVVGSTVWDVGLNFERHSN